MRAIPIVFLSALVHGSAMAVQWVCTEIFSDTIVFTGNKRGGEEELVDHSAKNAAITLFPNPIRAGAQSTIAGLSKGDFKITLQDLGGRRMLNAGIQLNESESIQITIPETLASGIYLLYLSGRSFQQTFKIAVQ